MKPLDQPTQARIIAALEQRGVREDCPSCGHTDRPLRPEVSFVYLGAGNGVPCVTLLCPRCGHVDQHALAALGE